MHLCAKGLKTQKVAVIIHSHTNREGHGYTMTANISRKHYIVAILASAVTGIDGRVKCYNRVRTNVSIWSTSLTYLLKPSLEGGDKTACNNVRNSFVCSFVKL